MAFVVILAKTIFLMSSMFLALLGLAMVSVVPLAFITARSVREYASAFASLALCVLVFSISAWIMVGPFGFE